MPSAVVDGFPMAALPRGVPPGPWDRYDHRYRGSREHCPPTDEPRRIMAARYRAPRMSTLGGGEVGPLKFYTVSQVNPGSGPGWRASVVFGARAIEVNAS